MGEADQYEMVQQQMEGSEEEPAVHTINEGEEEAITGMNFNEGGEGHMPIVMMVPEGQEGLSEAGEGFANAAVLKVPTSDGGERVLLIPISSDGGGNAVFALPGGLSLADMGHGDMGGEGGNQQCVTVALQGAEGHMGAGDPGVLTLPMVTDAMTGQVSMQFAKEPVE